MSDPIRISRKWAMPNSNTFDIAAIGQFIAPYIYGCEGTSIDPFANRNRIASVTNDIDPEMGCDHCMDALDFLRTFKSESVDLVLFDPPYSPRQIAECYKRLGKSVNMETTQASFWSDMKDEVGRIVRPGGYVLCFGWNSQGVGITRKFQMKEILLVAHGGAHNDTICTAEQKFQYGLFQDNN